MAKKNNFEIKDIRQSIVQDITPEYRKFSDIVMLKMK